MDDSSPVIKRAVRTYGRPKAPRADPAFDADTSFGSPTLLLDASSGSVDLDLSDVADFPPNSSPDVSFGSHLGDDGDDDDNDPGAAFINGFTWFQRFYAVMDTANDRVGIATTQSTNSTSN